MPGPTDPAVLRQQVAAQRAEFDALASTLVQMSQQAAVFDQQAAMFARMGQSAQADAFVARANGLRAAAAGVHKRRSDLSDLIAGAIVGYSDDPCDAGVTTPMLLLPLRLETRFAKAADGSLQLKIRIFPDTIHLDTLRRTLTDAERAAGDLYWAKAASLDPADTPDLRWRRLVAAVGPTRAAWVAACRGPNPPTLTGGDAAVARLLPDRFVAVVNPKRPGNFGTPTIAVGKPITLPPALNPLGEAVLAKGDLTIVNDVPFAKSKANDSATGAQWIADYAAAEKIGLAITVPSVPANILELVVVGVRNADPAVLAGELDALFDAHRYSDGLGLVAPGTPSNNLAEQRAGWSPEPPSAPPATVGAATGNRARIAGALGIGARALAGLPGADEDWDADARAGNAALWWPTWGDFLERIDVQHDGKTYRLTDRQREDLRRAHKEAVRGRGPLPTLRVGKQPYGLLPIGLVNDPSWTADVADATLLNGVRQLRERWKKAAWNVPSLTKGAPVNALPAVQAMAPVSFGLYVRQAVAKELLADGKMDSDVELERFLDALVLEDFFGEKLGASTPGASVIDPLSGKKLPSFSSSANLSLSGDQKPLALPMAHDSDPAALTQMAAAKAASSGFTPKSVLQALAALALAEAGKRQKKNPITMVDAVGSKLTDGARKFTAADVATATAKGSAALFALADSAQTSNTDGAIYARYQPDHGSAAGYAELASAAINPAAARELAELAQWTIPLAAGHLADVTEALSRLARPGLSTKDRAILVGEALDLASHRYDAWATALATKRAAALRAKTATGIRIGAWGYVHDLKPADKKATYNYIHAPSMAHAVTAGILRSAYDGHKLQGDKDAFAIDLSSARVRLATDLIDARRGGQSLSEALGYRLERGLTSVPAVNGNKLDGFIRNLRRAKWTPAPGPVGPGMPTGALTIDPAAIGSKVCDGVALLQAYRSPNGAAMLEALVNAAPEDNPYLQGAWVVLQGTEKAAFLAAFAAVDAALDACGDLVLAETLHQHVQGNVMRTAAVADASTAGTAPMPAPSVIATPTGSRTLAHRAMLLAGPAVAGGPVWPTGSPRAIAAPELEAWAASRLGPAENVVVALGPLGLPFTMQSIGLSALDFIYLSGDKEGLSAIVRRRMMVPPDFPLLEDRTPDWPNPARRAYGEAVATADVLRQSLLGARPATVGDFAAPNALTPVRQAAIAAGLSRMFDALKLFRDALATFKSASPQPAAIDGALDTLFGFGVTERPDAADAGGVAALAKRLDAQRVTAEAALLLDPQTGQMTHQPTAAAIVATGQALFGEGFWVLTPSLPVGADDPWDAARPSAAPRGRLRRWMADMASVRPAMARFGEGVLLSEALGRAPALSAVQIAEPQAETWTNDFAGDTRPDGIAQVTLLERSGGAGAAVGLVFDAYLEPIPDTGPRTTAVAFSAPAPNARPPQVMLLAVPPDKTRWTTDKLIATVLEAIDLAKMRGVTLERVQGFGRMLPAAYVRSWSFDDTPTIDFRQTAGELPPLMRYVKGG